MNRAGLSRYSVDREGFLDYLWTQRCRKTPSRRIDIHKHYAWRRTKRYLRVPCCGALHELRPYGQCCPRAW